MPNQEETRVVSRFTAEAQNDCGWYARNNVEAAWVKRKRTVGRPLG
jgi:hypothetical protein